MSDNQAHSLGPLEVAHQSQTEAATGQSKRLIAKYQEETVLRNEILKGAFSSSFFPDGDKSWRSPLWKLQVFVSSTFTDTMLERDILMKDIQPALREKGRSEGVEVAMVDMRWGVRDENTLDHRTWIDCWIELERCRAESRGLFFLSLQSNKYGYIPLPRVIPRQVLDDRLGDSTKVDEETRSMTQKWYTLDCNAIPPEYVLKSLTTINDDEYWRQVLPKLSRALEGLCYWREDQTEGGHTSPDIVIGRSVTEWETKCALRDACIESRDIDRVFWTHRSFAEGSVNDITDPRKLFDDTRNDNMNRAQKLADLKQWMESKLAGSDRVQAYQNIIFTGIPWQGDELGNLKCAWKDKVSNVLSSSLQVIIDEKQSWDENGCGLGIRGDHLTEMLHHCSWAQVKAATFTGRETLLQEVMSKIEQRGNSSSTKTRGGYGGVEDPVAITLSLIGGSGCGKTSLMAKAANLLFEWQSCTGRCKERPVIVRFCGTSSGSANGLSLVSSICRQIHAIYKLPEDVPQDFKQAVLHFHELLNSYPVALFIDSLDQLTNDNRARSDLTFLAGVKPHPDSVIVVSSLPDDNPQSSLATTSPASALASTIELSTLRKYRYGCHTKLKQWHVPCVDVPLISTAGSEARNMMATALQRRGRQLSSQQWSIVMNAATAEPTALYLSLAARVVESWVSSRDLCLCVLAGGVQALIEQIFESVEVQFGRELVRSALGMITFAVEGVSNLEMEDLLSCNGMVMSCVNQYNTAERLPTHVWFRIRESLRGLLAERQGGCLVWYHRQLKETAERRYGSLEERKPLHEIMARYFGNLVDSSYRTVTLVSHQPLVLNGESDSVWFPFAQPNKRRCIEAVRHMLQAGMIEEAERELCNVEGITARAKSGVIFSTLEEVRQLNSMMLATNPSNKRPYHYLRWLQNEVTAISESPQCNVFATGINQPFESHVRLEMNQVKNCIRYQPCFNFNLTVKSWIRSSVLGGWKKLTPLLNTLHGHTSMVSSVAISFDGGRIVSGSSDMTLRVWDALSGECIKVLEGHTDKVSSAAISSNGSRIVSGSEDKTIRIWDALSGECINVVTGHTAKVLSVAISSDGSRIMSGSWDKTIRIWDALSGECIKVLEGHTKPVRSVAISSDGSRIISGDWDGTLRLWDALSGECLKVLIQHRLCVSSVAMSSDGSRITSGSWDKSIGIWDTLSGECIKVIEDLELVSSVAMSSDGSRILSGSASGDKTIRIWDALSGQCMKVIQGHTDCVTTVIMSTDGSRVISGSKDITVRIWDALSGEGYDIFDGHLDYIYSIAMNFDGSRIISSSSDKTLRIWDALSGECIKVIDGHTKPVNTVTVSPDGSRIISGSQDRTIGIWNALSGECIKVLQGHAGWISSVIMSSDGGRIVSGSSDETIRIWDALSGECIKVLEGHLDYESSIAISSDGSRIVSGSNYNDIGIWDALSGECIKVLQGHNGKVRSVAVSLDASRIVSCSQDKTLRIWDTLSGECTTVLEGHRDEVVSIAMSSDERKIISFSLDVTIRIWDALSGECIKVLDGLTDCVYPVVMSLDGSRIISGSMEKTIRIWDVVEYSHSN